MAFVTSLVMTSGFGDQLGGLVTSFWKIQFLIMTSDQPLVTSDQFHEPHDQFLMTSDQSLMTSDQFHEPPDQFLVTSDQFEMSDHQWVNLPTGHQTRWSWPDWSRKPQDPMIYFLIFFREISNEISEKIYG